MNAHADKKPARKPFKWPETDVLRAAAQEAGYKIDVGPHATWLTEPGRHRGDAIHCIDEGNALRLAWSLTHQRQNPEEQPQTRVMTPVSEVSTQAAAPAAP